MDMETNKTVLDFLQERIEMYCDADRRRKADAQDLERYCPTVEEAEKVWATA